MCFFPCCGSGVVGSGVPGGSELAFTDIKVADYIAAVGDFVRVDPSAGGFTVTAPPNPAKDQRFGILNQSDSMATITVAGGGNLVTNILTFETVASTAIAKNGFSVIYQFDGAGTWLIT